jgi:hypothetical protein
MTDQNPYPQPQSSDQDWRDNRRHSTSRWVPGLVLIGLGAIFLLNNLTGFELHNWWALFILIPAFGTFARAWDLHQHGASFDRQMRGVLFGGVILTSLAAVFLFDLSWTIFGPVLLILLGGGMLVSAFLP